jgi:ATP diphosphatase
LQKRAARVGFDWPDVEQVLDKIREEIDELKEAESAAHRHEEFGDLMFVMANLARHLTIDPEQALRDANQKFTRRFNRIEDKLQQDGRTPFTVGSRRDGCALERGETGGGKTLVK